MQRTVDYLRVVILILILLFCAWSALHNLVKHRNESQRQSIPLITTKKDFGVCSKYRERQLESCKSKLEEAYADVSIKCSKYLSTYQNCKYQVSKGCNIFESNLLSCTRTIVNEFIQSWENSK